MLLFRSLFIFMCVLCCSFAWGVGIVHQLKPGASFLSLLSQGGCSIYINFEGAESCNAALHSINKIKSEVGFNLVGKADGDSVDYGRSLLFEPISRQLLDDIFRSGNLLSFSLNSKLYFKNKYFSLEYSPYYLLADAYIFIPSFPEISLLIVRQEAISIGSGVELSQFTFFDDDIFSIGVRMNIISRQIYKNNILLSSLAINSNNVIAFEEQEEISGDVGIYYSLWKNSFLSPAISFQVRNIGSIQNIENSRLEHVTKLEPLMLLEMYSQIGMGGLFKTDFGNIYFGMEHYFDGVFSFYYADYWNINLMYTLGYVSCGGAYSPYFKTFGFYFVTDITEIGLVYAKEEEVAGKAISNDFTSNSIYLSLVLKI